MILPSSTSTANPTVDANPSPSRRERSVPSKRHPNQEPGSNRPDSPSRDHRPSEHANPNRSTSNVRPRYRCSKTMSGQ